MSESPLYTKPLLKASDIAIEDLIGIAHPRGGMSDDCAITVMALAEAMGIGVIAHHQAATVAKHVPVPHQQKDVGFVGFAPLPLPDGRFPAGFLAAAKTRVNALKANAMEHAPSVGTRDAEGAHKTGSSTSFAPDATDLATAIALCQALATWFAAHCVAANVHFHDDPLGAAFGLPIANPANIYDLTVDLNALTAALHTHAAFGVA